MCCLLCCCVCCIVCRRVCCNMCCNQTVIFELLESMSSRCNSHVEVTCELSYRAYICVCRRIDVTGNVQVHHTCRDVIVAVILAYVRYYYVLSHVTLFEPQSVQYGTIYCRSDVLPTLGINDCLNGHICPLSELFLSPTKSKPGTFD